jgi:DNA invertase Pin-like site-specific DNA recombinase
LTTTLEKSADAATRIPIVRVGIESGDRGHGSPEDQVHRIAEHPAANEGGRFCVGEFMESGRTGYKGERGPELEAAISAARAAAVEYGTAELWLFHTSRAARGDGTKGRRSFMKLYADLLYENVQVRSVTDDEFATRPVLVGIASEQNHKYSADLSAHVTRGKAKARGEGKRPGGPVPDGYTAKVTPHPSQPSATVREFTFNVERQPTLARLFELALEGLPPLTIGRTLNAEGHRTAKGGSWDRRNVEDKLLNAFYAGAVVYFRGSDREQINWEPAEAHPGYITREQFGQLLRTRRSRDKARGSNRSPKGRPPTNHMLANLLPCPRCGSKMRGMTSPYRRKSDGGRARLYRCDEVHRQTGLCDQPDLKAEPVERALAAGLRGLFVDFDGWLESIASQRGAEREGIERDLERQRAALREARDLEGKLSDDFAQHVGGENDARADAAAVAMARQRERAEQLERAISDLEDARAAASEAAPVDAMLDFWNGLRKGIDAALDTGSIATVNAALRERFTAFHIAVGEDGTIAITPELPPESPAVVVWDSPDGERPASDDPAAWAAFYRENPPTAARLVTFDNGGEGERFPALIDPSQNSRNAHE